MIIDTHAHLQFDAFKDDLFEVVKRTLAENIWAINVGTSYETSRAGVELAERQEGFYAAIGLHPTDVDEKFNVQDYRQLAQSKKVVAIGEIGLDYFREPFDKEKQKDIFLQQVTLAKELQLPVIIHCRKAHDEMIEILKDQNLRGVIHCFTGTFDQAEKYVGLGFYLGLNGIMFKFDLKKVIKTIPLGHFVLETDCPYLTPPAAPQKRNEPIYMKYTIQKIAELKSITPEEVSQKTTENARMLFNIYEKHIINRSADV